MSEIDWLYALFGSYVVIVLGYCVALIVLPSNRERSYGLQAIASALVIFLTFLFFVIYH